MNVISLFHLYLDVSYDWNVCIDGPPIRSLDITHPALKAFEIVYLWDNSAQVDDLGLGIVCLFGLTLIGLIVLCCVSLNGTSPTRTSSTSSHSGGSASNNISTKRTRNVLYPNRRTKVYE